MRKTLRTATLAVAGVLLLGLALIGVTRLADLDLPFGSERIDRSQPALLTSIRELSEYHAAEGHFQVVVDVEDDVSWVPDFIAGERSLFVAAGTVDAYVDLSGLGEGDLTVSEDGTKVTIRLPEAELDEPDLDQERTYLFSQERGVVNRVGDALSTQDQSDLYQDAEARLADAAEESALTEQAEENTRAMLTGMFASLDMEVAFTGDGAGSGEGDGRE